MLKAFEAPWTTTYQQTGVRLSVDRGVTWLVKVLTWGSHVFRHLRRPTGFSDSDLVWNLPCITALPYQKLTALRQCVEKIGINKPAGEITLVVQTAPVGNLRANQEFRMSV